MRKQKSLSFAGINDRNTTAQVLCYNLARANEQYEAAFTRDKKNSFVETLKAKRNEAEQKLRNFFSELKGFLNAEKIFLFLIPKISGRALRILEGIIADQPYRLTLLQEMPKSKGFAGFSESSEAYLIEHKDEALDTLILYFNKGFELSDESSLPVLGMEAILAYIYAGQGLEKKTQLAISSLQCIEEVGEDVLETRIKAQTMPLIRAMIEAINPAPQKGNRSVSKLCPAWQLLLVEDQNLLLSYLGKMGEPADRILCPAALRRAQVNGWI